MAKLRAYRNLAIYKLVDSTGLEPATPTMST